MADETLTFKPGHVQHYYPLVMQYLNSDTGKSWKLEIQAKPVPALIFRGEKPPLNEIIASLSSMHAPVWMIPIIETLIDIAIQQQTLNLLRVAKNEGKELQ